MKQLALDEDFEGGPTEIYKRFNSTPARSKFNEMTNDRTLFYYDDLYLSDSCPFPDHSHREDEWLMFVEQDLGATTMKMITENLRFQKVVNEKLVFFTGVPTVDGVVWRNV